MTRFIIRIKDLYFEWSTFVDAPVTRGLTRDEMRRHLLDKHGQYSYPDDRLATADQWGSTRKREQADGTAAGLETWPSYMTAAECVLGNAAGDGETELTIDEIYQQYGLR